MTGQIYHVCHGILYSFLGAERPLESGLVIKPLFAGKVCTPANPPALRGGLGIHKGDEKLEKQPISETNLILIDWITFTTKAWSVDQLISQMGLEDQSWDVKDHGFHGYGSARVFNGVTVMFDGRLNEDGQDDMGVCVECSGQGCRALETYGGIDWVTFLAFLTDEYNEFNITRIDLAFDDHTQILNKFRLKIDTDEHYYRSKFRFWEIRYGSSGFTIYHGSAQSQARIRIYDKAAERGLFDGTHWIRVEIQLRDENAFGAAKTYVQKQDIGAIYGGFLATYLVYLQDCNDSNKSRWETADYWDELIQDAERIHVASKPGVEYNIFHLDAFLRDTAGGALKTWIQIFGLDALPDLLKQHHGRLNPRHQALLNQYHHMRKDIPDE